MNMAAHTSRVTSGWGASQTCAYCHGFAKIPPLLRGTDGRMHINPDFEMVKRFHLRAEPFGATIPAGGNQVFSLTPPAEEESLGDMLISEFLGLFTPDTVQGMTVEFLNIQTDKVFQNAPIPNSLILGNAHLNCCLPCCTLVQATNTLQVKVTNNEAVPVGVEIVARGKRFVPKSDELRARMLNYWNQIPSYPYFLTFDQGDVVIPAGATVEAIMTVQGSGDFEVKQPRCEVISAGATTADDILISVTEGIGRAWQSDPLPLGAFVATPTLAVAGFPGGLYRAASACHCPPFSQLFKRNTRVRHVLQNTGAAAATVRIVYAGCFHRVSECGPSGRSMDRVRSLEPTIGPILIAQRDLCPTPPAPPVPVYQYQPAQPQPGLSGNGTLYFDEKSGAWRKA